MDLCKSKLSDRLFINIQYFAYRSKIINSAGLLVPDWKGQRNTTMKNENKILMFFYYFVSLCTEFLRKMFEKFVLNSV